MSEHSDGVILQEGIQKLVETSDAFAFLHDEEDLYSLDHLKEQYINEHHRQHSIKMIKKVDEQPLMSVQECLEQAKRLRDQVDS